MWTDIQQSQTLSLSATILSSPQTGEQLYMYLAVSDYAVSVVLFCHIRDKEQRLVYYVSKAMVDAEINQVTMLTNRLYFQAHQVTMLTNQPLKSILHKLDLSGRMLKWVIQLSEYITKYQHKLALKGQVIVDFIVELPQKPSHLIDSLREGWWTLHVDGACRASGAGIGLILQSPTGELLKQAIWLGFPASNNEAEYEAILAKLNLALTLAAVKLKICIDSQLIIEQIQKEYEAKNERMARYLTLVEDRLAKLGEWAIERVPQT